MMSELKLRPPEENANPSADHRTPAAGSGEGGRVLREGLVLLGAGVVEKRIRVAGGRFAGTMIGSH